ncbi:MAG TPA: hypothetical protein VED66_01145 [Candidatus Sulfotelmatobacter sp.]|nr:hypothetical protein [Candidatus Sulfotelmatobacter sp.]
MRVLLLHPEDSPRRGRWSQQSWDLIVDLGSSSEFSTEAWARQCGCPVLRADLFRQPISDAKLVRQIFSAGRGRLVDEEGIDWWDVLSLLVVPDALIALALGRLAAEIGPSAELWATRPGWPASVVAALSGHSLRSFRGGRLARSAARALHYAGLLRRFSAAQIKQILLDKYDSGHRMRSRFVPTPQRCADSVVLLPSAYENVSRVAAAYARMLPEQSFLLVATRRSGKNFVPSANIQVRDLAAYAKADVPSSEIASLAERWFELKASLVSARELQVLSRVGVLDPFPGWLRDGVCAREGWSEVIEREPVCGVLCGDDSNPYTRLPVLLAARRKLPTVDFHHGAFDGRYLLKELPCDVYLAKNEMERDYLLRVCGLPEERLGTGAPPGHVRSASEPREPQGTSAIFFSEPYEIAGPRGEEVYREILPALCRLAGGSGHDVIIKLHPFESRSQRWRLVTNILSAADRQLVTVREGPLTNELLSRAWFGLTVESTTVMDCLQYGVCCFLCGWLASSPYGYVEQFTRFGVGEVLENAAQLDEIPQRLADFHNRRPTAPNLSDPVDPAMLKQWLTSRPGERSGARRSA